MQPVTINTTRLLVQAAILTVMAVAATDTAITDSADSKTGDGQVRNCKGTYGPWTTCSHSCGTLGTMSRDFSIIEHAANGGKKCPETHEAQACNWRPCAVPATTVDINAQKSPHVHNAAVRHCSKCDCECGWTKNGTKCTPPGDGSCCWGCCCTDPTPSPPTPSPPPAPSPPTPPHAGPWVRTTGLNCYPGHGATDLETPTGSNCGVMSLADCQQKCVGLSGCEGITVAKDASSGHYTCYRRGNIQLGSCERSPGFTTYVNASWGKGAGLNCYGGGHGATDLESPPGSNAGVMSLASCQQKCADTEACDGITVKRQGGSGDQYECYRRGSMDFSDCDQHSDYDSFKYCCGPEPQTVYTNHYDPENPLKIQVDNQTRSNNYFLIIGDWGRSGGPTQGDCMDGVAKMMKAYVTKQKAAGKTLLFIAAVGDNFYWNGVDPSFSWQHQWAVPYGTTDAQSPLFNVPWLAVHGNHDLGNTDPHAFCPDVAPKARLQGQNYAGQQLNADRNPTRPNYTAHYWLPDFNYHYHIPEVGLELIAIDRNSNDISGLGGDPGGHAQAFKDCGGQAKVENWLNMVGESGDALLRSRAANGTATSTVIIQHYPGLCGRDVFEGALRQGRETQLLCAYGHTHDQKCDSVDSKHNTCGDLMTGGGGGCCGPEVNLAGFTAVHLNDKGGFTVDVDSDDVRMHSGQCQW